MSTRTWFPLGGRDTAPLKVQEQLKCVDQEACLQLDCETGHRLQGQSTILGLVPRKRVESREQVTESFCVPEGFFNWMALEPQPTKFVPRRVRLAIERNIVAMSPDRILQPENTTRKPVYKKASRRHDRCEGFPCLTRCAT